MKRSLALLIAALGTTPWTAVAADGNGALMSAAEKFGTSHIDLLVSAARVATSGPSPSQNEVDRAAAEMVQAYRRTMFSTQVVGVFDATHEAIFGLIDASTGGSSLVATIPLRYAKNQVAAALTAKVERDAQLAETQPHQVHRRV